MTFSIPLGSVRKLTLRVQGRGQDVRFLLRLLLESGGAIGDPESDLPHVLLWRS